MGVIRKQRGRPKPKPNPVIDYPPVPTRKWIPPDQRPKKDKPPPYQKPEGITQKLKISSLNKIWHQFKFVGNTAILIGHYSQTHRKYNFKTNGYQGSCNCAIACIFALLYKMARWDRHYLDRILDLGDDLYIRSITQTGSVQCKREVTPQEVFNSVYLGRRKISIAIDDKSKIVAKITIVAEQKVKEAFQENLEKLFKISPVGIFTMAGKSIAIWIQDETYYLFDPTDHDELGGLWKGLPGYGYSIVFRCHTLEDLIDTLCQNVEKINMNTKFELISCLIQRIVIINTEPPHRLDDTIPPVVVTAGPVVEHQQDSKVVTPESVQEKRLQKHLEDDTDSFNKHLEEVSPDATAIPQDKRPRWSQRPSFQKKDVCKMAIPGKVYPECVSYFIGDIPSKSNDQKEPHMKDWLEPDKEVEPAKMSILRGATCQTDTKFSKYQGRQSMGNAVSALVMLRLHKSKTWVPMIVNTILKYGDLMYRDAMLTIPRTQSLKLSNFQRKTEYEGKNFMPEVEDYVVIGRLQSEDFEIIDLFPALETFLTDNECCVIIGPLTVAVWIEDSKFYMFDPNERDKNGKAFKREKFLGDNFVQLDYIPGVACVTCFPYLNDLVYLYMENIEKPRRHDAFYLSKVQVVDFVEIPDPWYNFTGIDLGKWILRGTKSQSDRKYTVKSRNFQGPANCLIALAIQGLNPMKDWAAVTIDEILDLGDHLYCETIDKLTEKNSLLSNLLTLNEVNKRYTMCNTEVNFDIGECIINGVINPLLKSDTMDLRKGIREFFKDNETGIVTSRNISVAIWKVEEIFYYFDSHDRDEQGLKTDFGTACVLRTIDLEDLATCLESNLYPCDDDCFNISRVKVVCYEKGPDDTILLPIIDNYTRIDEDSAILRSLYSEKSTKYSPNCGKQTIPMCMTALAFNKLKPSLEWIKHDIDEILNKGDNLYIETMNEINTQKILDINKAEVPEATEEMEKQKLLDINKAEVPEGTEEMEKQKILDINKAEVPEATKEMEKHDEENDVSTENVKKKFSIGFNQFEFHFDDVATGNIAEDLKDQLQKVLVEVKQKQGDSLEEIILESKPLSVAIWVTDQLFYVFDSKPRDKQGYVIGMEDWSEPEGRSPEDILEDLEEYLGAEDSESYERIPHYMESEMEGEEPTLEAFGGAGDAGLSMIKEQEDISEEEMANSGVEDEYEDESLHYFKPIHRSSSFWGEQEKYGKACVRWFSILNDVVDYIYGNIPPKLTKGVDFSLKSVKINNKVQVKDKMRNYDDMVDVYSGPWYSFEEVEHGFWILKGTRTIYDQLFPEKNRGKQLIPACCIALVINNLYGMMSFNEFTVDSILAYGDKLYTFVKKTRKKQLMENARKKLSEDEVDWLIEHEEFEVGDIPKRICLSSFLTEIEIQQQAIVSDIHSKTVGIKAALQTYFETNQYGLLQCKDLTVALWKGKDVYYMFDGLHRGSSGLETPIGVACITRYLSLEKLASVFKANIPKLGRNTFYLHKLNMIKGLCPRKRGPKLIADKKPKLISGGFISVIPGKSIVRGSISQEDPRFGKGPNILSVPIAIVALTMSLVHKASMWSKPIVDDIIELGAQLYEETVDSLGYDFDPWQDKMTIDKVLKDFTIGVLKVNCEFRFLDQTGIIESKSGEVLNLRQGIERFFEENTHGVIITESLTLAIWEEQLDNGEPIIYLFDPNPRGPLGMPVFSGAACVVTLVNSNIAANHIIGCILEPDQRMGEFHIVPVEIVVGDMKTKTKAKKSLTKSSIVALPRCSELVVSEEKKALRKIAENERKRKEVKRRELLGRKGYYILNDGEAILRGYRSQNSDIYSEESRNNQDITNCIVAIVMHYLFSIENWNAKHIDLILDTGNQLYIDSYIAYGPQHKKLGMQNIMRKFLMKNLEIHVTIYKPIKSDLFNTTNLKRTLSIFFQQEQFCMLSYNDQWISIIFKSGLFYLFDPHERNIDGRTLRVGEKESSAVVLRFNDLKNLSLRIIDNFIGNDEQEVEDFTLWLLSVNIKL